MQRVVIPELLDCDAGTPEEIRRSLADLRRVNAWFGGVRTTRVLVDRVLPQTDGQSLSLLDVGAGSGDISLAIQRTLARKSVCLEVTLLDRSLAHLDGVSAPLSSPPGRGRSSNSIRLVRRVVANGLALPFADASFDLVTCSLLVHHLDPPEFVDFVNETLRVCRVALLINDLRRSAVSLALVYAGLPLFNRITRHDSVASVRRAYTAEEMQAMLHHTRARRVEITSHFLFRMGAIVWKDSSQASADRMAA